MVDRSDLGSWVQGPDAAHDPAAYPGERLGRPRDGSRSIAPTGRRVAALLIDWVLCMLIARGFFGPEALQPNGALSVTGVFVLVNVLLVGTASATMGQRLMGLRVERDDGGPPGLFKALIRGLLLGLGLPALTALWQADRRGLHDLASATLVARR